VNNPGSHTVNIVILILSSIIALIISYIAYRRRHFPGAQVLMWLMLIVAVWKSVLCNGLDSTGAGLVLFLEKPFLFWAVAAQWFFSSLLLNSPTILIGFLKHLNLIINRTRITLIMFGPIPFTNSFMVVCVIKMWPECR